MSKFLRVMSVLLCLFVAQLGFGQSLESVQQLLGRAVVLMDEGKLDASIELLEQADEMYPKNYLVAYEMAYAYCMKQEYKKAIKILKKLKKHDDVTDLNFQLLGNCYDIIGDTEKAMKTYKEGLDMFPNSGPIWLEVGNIFWAQEDYTTALKFYQQGIEVAPHFPSNYYRATLLFVHTTEEVWAMMYGELFMNLESGTKRTAEISKLLYDKYLSEISFDTDTSFTVSFSQNAEINLDDLKDPSNFKLPFGIGAYEPNLLLSLVNEKVIDIHTLNRVRERFVGLYFKNGFDKKYPNVLLDYQKEIVDAGHFEAYNYWLLSQGEPEEFEKWKSDNEELWAAFTEWFKENKLQLDENNRLHSEMY